MRTKCRLRSLQCVVLIYLVQRGWHSRMLILSACHTGPVWNRPRVTYAQPGRPLSGTLVSRQRKALGKRTLRSLRRESISSSGGEGVALKIAPLTPQGEEMAPVLSTAPLPDPQVLEIEDQGSKRGVRTLVGSLSSECGFPKASPHRSKSRKKCLGKALGLARKKQS